MSASLANSSGESYILTEDERLYFSMDFLAESLEELHRATISYFFLPSSDCRYGRCACAPLQEISAMSSRYYCKCSHQFVLVEFVDRPIMPTRIGAILMEMNAVLKVKCNEMCVVSWNEKCDWDEAAAVTARIRRCDGQELFIMIMM